MPQRNRPVTNDVLLEKLSNHISRFDKFEASVSQNFSSLADVLKEGYVTKDQLQPYIDRITHLEDVIVPGLQAAIEQRVYKDTLKPYLWVLNSIAALGFTGFVTLVGKMIFDYVRGGPPQ